MFGAMERTDVDIQADPDGSSVELPPAPAQVTSTTS
jgi:hypothetical protein